MSYRSCVPPKVGGSRKSSVVLREVTFVFLAREMERVYWQRENQCTRVTSITLTRQAGHLLPSQGPIYWVNRTLEMTWQIPAVPLVTFSQYLLGLNNSLAAPLWHNLIKGWTKGFSYVLVKMIQFTTEAMNFSDLPTQREHLLSCSLVIFVVELGLLSVVWLVVDRFERARVLRT